MKVDFIKNKTTFAELFTALIESDIKTPNKLTEIQKKNVKFEKLQAIGESKRCLSEKKTNNYLDSIVNWNVKFKKRIDFISQSLNLEDKELIRNELNDLQKEIYLRLKESQIL